MGVVNRGHLGGQQATNLDPWGLMRRTIESLKISFSIVIFSGREKSLSWVSHPDANREGVADHWAWMLGSV